MAVGLGSMDMPVPAVARWEWLNWKFPRAVHAGDTIYARWTLTQKRAPVGGEPTAIVVWRVDVHTADGALCAEGEVGASVLRRVGAPKAHVAESAEVTEVAEPTSPAPRRRGRRRAPAGDGANKPIEPKAPALLTPPVQAAAPGAGSMASPGGRPRRRRRRRSPGSAAARNGDTPSAAGAADAPTAPASPPAAAPAERGAGAEQGANPLTRAIRRLRRP